MRCQTIESQPFSRRKIFYNQVIKMVHSKRDKVIKYAS